MRASVLASSVLPRAGRADQQHVALVDFDIVGVPRPRSFVRGQPLVVIVHRDRERLLGVVLADDVLVEEFLDLPRRWGSC